MKHETLILPDGTQIPYQLEHRARRTIGLKITDDGLVVHAPRRIFLFELNRVLQEKAQWIVSKLEARQQNRQPPMVWTHGADLHYLGNLLTLEIIVASSAKKPQLVQEKLHIHIKTPALEANTHAEFEGIIQRRATQWLKEQALQDFSRRIEVFAAKLGVATPPLALSNAQARWGSCSSRGEIRLNWRLIQAPPHIINYVVCHELAHLKHMNHSAQFWAQVETLYPDYKRAEKELKALSPLLHRI